MTDNSGPPEHATKDLDRRKLALECKKLALEAENLQRTRRFPSGGLVLQLLTVLGVGGLGSAIYQQRQQDKVQKELAHQQTVQLETQLKNGFDKMDRQFQYTKEGRYWDSSLRLCQDIAGTAGRMEAETSPVPATLREFETLLYGRAALLEGFGDGELRTTMMSYYDKFLECGSATCRKGLAVCVEAMVCECRKIICQAPPDGPAERSVFRGCPQTSKCPELADRCKGAIASRIR
jgi:hypothetical protein